MKTQILCFLLISCLALFTHSCDNAFREIAEGLGEKNCTDQATTPAGPGRRVLLSAQNHIYVVGQAGRYDPDMTTKNPHSGAAWKNADLVQFRSKQINRYFPKMNQILEDNRANICVYYSGYEICVVTQDKIQADIDPLGARGKTAKLVVDLINKDPKHIHLLWLWTSTSDLTAVGSPWARYIVVGDDPKAGTPLGEMLFAHEFGHVLGYHTHVFNDPSNLMNDGPIGTKLNQQQLQTIWTSLNCQYDRLLKLSCDR